MMLRSQSLGELAQVHALAAHRCGGAAKQRIGHAAHRGGDHDDRVAGTPEVGRNLGGLGDGLSVADRRAAEFDHETLCGHGAATCSEEWIAR